MKGAGLVRGALLAGGVTALVWRLRGSSSSSAPALAPPVRRHAPRPRPRAPLPATPIKAYIYRQPNETVYRMAFGPFPAAAREMGLFDSVQAAQDIARAKGWSLAWEGARDL